MGALNGTPISIQLRLAMKPILARMLTASTLALPLPALAVQPGRVELLCHRTANQDIPENTLESLEQAALLGCDVVEVDLRRTLDGKIVLNHDGFLERLTDGHGEIESTFYDDLRMRDAGSWMSNRFSGMRIVLFEEALRLARERKIRLFLDMKDKGMGADVLAILRREDMLDQVEFGGEWDEIKTLYPQANLATQNSQWVSPPVTMKEIAQLHQQGRRVIVNFSANKYEVDLAGMKAVVAAGADAINTDFPRLGADAVGRPVEVRLRELALQADKGESTARVNAILELGLYRSFPLENEFMHWLLDEDAHVSRASALALVRIRPAVAPSLFAEALHSPHASTRANAAWSLGQIKALANTVLPLLNDSDPQVLSETLVALAHMQGDVDSSVLLPLLAHADSSVRGAAAVALAWYQPQIAAQKLPQQFRLDAAAEQEIYRRHVSNGGGGFTQAEIDALVAEYRCQMQMLRALHIANQAEATEELESTAFNSEGLFPEPDGAVAALMLWDRLAAQPAAAVSALSSEDMRVAGRAEWALMKAGPAILSQIRSTLQNEGAAQQHAIHIVAWQGDLASLETLRKIQSSGSANAALAGWAIDTIHNLHPAL
jgi:glycerophosphoryl diester phosphodiesterase